MTVKELIAILKTVDKNAEVEVANAQLITDYKGEPTWKNGGTRTLWEDGVVETETDYGKKVILG